MLAAGDACKPLHGVPFSIKDSIDLEGRTTTAGTIGRKHALPALQDATLVQRLRSAGAIPIAKTNLPDLLFAFETDNLLFGRSNNPYDLSRTPGGSSGGESALIAACGSPLGLGSDASGSVRLPAAFCGIASIKPTQGVCRAPAMFRRQAAGSRIVADRPNGSPHRRSHARDASTCWRGRAGYFLATGPLAQSRTFAGNLGSHSLPTTELRVAPPRLRMPSAAVPISCRKLE